MSKKRENSQKERLIDKVNKPFIILVLFFILIGICLILASSYISNEYPGHEILTEFLKEIGVVILAVFTVSSLYEVFVAKKYSREFLASLQEQIERGESNFAVCAHLGILEIFPHRDRYREKYPLDELVKSLNSSSKIHVVGQSLNLLMANPKVITDAIERGAQVDICLLNPNSLTDKHPDLQPEHIALTIAVLRSEIINWIKESVPDALGSIEIRYHQVLLIDSYLNLTSPSQNLMVWDWGFGRDSAYHKIIKLDSQKPLGQNIQNRYEYIWNNAEKIFKYANGKIITDEMEKAINIGSKV